MKSTRNARYETNSIQKQQRLIAQSLAEHCRAKAELYGTTYAQDVSPASGIRITMLSASHAASLSI